MLHPSPLQQEDFMQNECIILFLYAITQVLLPVLFVIVDHALTAALLISV